MIVIVILHFDGNFLIVRIFLNAHVYYTYNFERVYFLSFQNTLGRSFSKVNFYIAVKMEIVFKMRPTRCGCN
jgi:hypothetical protein